MEVDFGHLGLTWDAATRSRKRTWVFSGRLRHCRRAYREVVFDQKQQTFFACHMHAFEWFGGVDRRVVRGPVGEPRLSRTRAALRVPDFALPAAPSRTQGRRRGRISSMSRGTSCRCSATPRRSAGARLPTPASWRRNWSAATVRTAISMSSRRSVALRPLPMTRWDPVVSKELNVGPDWRVQFDKAFYTVPYV